MKLKAPRFESLVKSVEREALITIAASEPGVTGRASSLLYGDLRRRLIEAERSVYTVLGVERPTSEAVFDRLAVVLETGKGAAPVSKVLGEALEEFLRGAGVDEAKAANAARLTAIRAGRYVERILVVAERLPREEVYPLLYRVSVILTSMALAEAGGKTLAVHLLESRLSRIASEVEAGGVASVERAGEEVEA